MSTTFPTTTESILQEEGAETTLIELAEQVAKAAADLRRVLRESEGPWTVRELQDKAANGRSSSVMSIAFLRLLKAGEVSIDYATSLVEAA
jgi:hypothetical protein